GQLDHADGAAPRLDPLEIAPFFDPLAHDLEIAHRDLLAPEDELRPSPERDERDRFARGRKIAFDVIEREPRLLDESLGADHPADPQSAQAVDFRKTSDGDE